jgi:hypothetical protein
VKSVDPTRGRSAADESPWIDGATGLIASPMKASAAPLQAQNPLPVADRSLTAHGASTVFKCSKSWPNRPFLQVSCEMDPVDSAPPATFGGRAGDRAVRPQLIGNECFSGFGIKPFQMAPGLLYRSLESRGVDGEAARSATTQTRGRHPVTAANFQGELRT